MVLRRTLGGAAVQEAGPASTDRCSSGHRLSAVYACPMLNSPCRILSETARALVCPQIELVPGMIDDRPIPGGATLRRHLGPSGRVHRAIALREARQPERRHRPKCEGLS